MKKLFFISFLFTLYFAGTCSLFAQTITWYQPDFPPYVILDEKGTAEQFSEYYKYWLDDELKVPYEQLRQKYKIIE